MNGTLTEDQKTAASAKAFIIADAVKDAGDSGVSSGYLFSIVKDCIPEDDFDSILLYLKREKVITEEGTIYFWVQREYCAKACKLISPDECDDCYNSDPRINQYKTLESCRKNILKEL